MWGMRPAAGHGGGSHSPLPRSVSGADDNIATTISGRSSVPILQRAATPVKAEMAYVEVGTRSSYRAGIRLLRGG